MLARGIGRGKPRPENQSYWMSYSDMMAALLLMFVLLLFLSFNRYVTLQDTKEAELAAKEEELALQQEQLARSQEELQENQRALSSLQALLNTQQFTLTEREAELAEKNEALAASQEELEQSLARLILQQEQIEEQERLLALSEEEIAEARRQLDEYSEDLENREILLSARDAELLTERLRVTDLETLLNEQKAVLDAQAAQIDELVGVRARIVEQLRDAFSQTGLEVDVDAQTGAITLRNAVFFDTDRANIKEEGRALLDQLIPLYFRTLMSQENADYVAEIIIEGHTDSDGTYEHNHDLSQRRALAVVNYCLGESFVGLTDAEKDQLRMMITANGRSESQLKYDAYGVEDKEASRRVEIKFRLKDAEMIDSLNRILSGDS